jgi:hypothetical protein
MMVNSAAEELTVSISKDTVRILQLLQMHTDLQGGDNL